MNIKSEPLFSVILPTYNRREGLKGALESLAAQTLKDFEVIVINDGGVEVRDILTPFQDSLKIEYIRLRSNMGVSVARNEGIKRASGKYIAYLDDDDIFYPNHLEIAFEGLHRQGAVSAYTNANYKHVVTINGQDIVLEEKADVGQPFDFDRLLLANFIPTPNIVHLKKLLDKTGQFDETLPVHEDWDLWIRIGKIAPFLHIPKTTTEIRTRRIPDTNYIKKRKLFLKTLKLIYARYADLVNGTIIRQQNDIEKQFLFEIFLYELDPHIGSLIHSYIKKNEEFFFSVAAQERERAKILKKELEDKAQKIAQLNDQLRDQVSHLNNQITTLETELKSARNELSKRDELITRLKHTLSAIENDLQLEKHRNQDLEEEVERLHGVIHQKDMELGRIYRSFGWRTVAKVYQAADMVMPPGTRPRVLTKLALSYVFNPKKSIQQVNRGRIKKFFHLFRYGSPKDLEQKVESILDPNFHQVEYIPSKIDFWSRFNQEEGPDPTISIIVPNYNHAPFLRQRLDAIYNQTYKNFEVILLDDASTDNSREILEEYAQKFPDITTVHFNKENSGCPFAQWKKGLSLAKGQLVWIAESDDYCTKNFLECLVPFFKNRAVMAAFARTEFISGGENKKIWTLEEYLSDIIGSSYWESDFIDTTHNLVNKLWAKKNIIPNVSSMIFRHPGELSIMEDEEWNAMKICGDWIFYLHLCRGGLIGYTPTATNFYRIHDENASVRTYSQDIYYQEHAKVAQTAVELYKIKREVILEQAEILKKHWVFHRGKLDEAAFNSLFDCESILRHSNQRKPNVLMVTFALTSGGGEVFPLRLANRLKDRGFGVTVLNCQQEPPVEDMQTFLRSDIPLINIEHQEDLQHIKKIIEELGIELVHSHHAWCDVLCCEALKDYPHCSLVVTTHGMYEMMSKGHFRSLVSALKRVDRFVYLTQKNIEYFTEFGFEKDKFVKIYNAIEPVDVTPIRRDELGLDPDAFVICVVSRAIPEKGWREAIKAVEIARTMSGRDLHILLVGNGPEYENLKRTGVPDHVHLLGFKPNVCDYFATADIGLLPSKFRGESFPLVLLECLHAGRPMIATNLGEIRNMLSTNGGLAGDVFDLKNGKIPIGRLAEILSKYATDKNYLDEKRALAKEAVRKFDIELMIDRYEDVYSQALRIRKG